MGDFFASMLPYASKASQATNIPTSVILAQWANESAYGQSDLAQRANNFAGIKYWGNSYINDGQSGMYANYNSLDRFTDAWIQFMGGSRYQAVRDAGSPTDTINALAASGYAEDPNYKNVVSGILSKNDLTKYDNGDYSGAASTIPSSISSIGKTVTDAFNSLFHGGMDQKKNMDNLNSYLWDLSSIGGQLNMISIDRLTTVNVNGKIVAGIVLDGKTFVYVRDAFEDVEYDQDLNQVKVK
jgi:hypothetical protein